MSGQVHFTTVSNAAEVRQISELQAANLPSALTPDTMASQGFVTVRHDLGVLQRMNEVALGDHRQGRRSGRRLRAGDAARVRVGRADPAAAVRHAGCALVEDTLLRDQPRWFVMGQVCIAEGYRGRGLFDGLYRAMAEAYRDRYDFTVTEVAARNTRSLRAHERAGFRTLQVYPDATTGEDWHVIVLDFT